MHLYGKKVCHWEDCDVLVDLGKVVGCMEIPGSISSKTVAEPQLAGFRKGTKIPT